MQMIPAIPHGTHSRAEKRVFDLLQAAFRNSPEEYTVYHSINLTRHAYKRFGEIDFLICSRSGIFVLEVKGGRIACKKGIWSYTNRYGEYNQSVEGPFKQAESALHGIRADLGVNLPPRLLSSFPIGYAVIFPDCIWDVSGAEWDRNILADAKDLNNIEQWLEKMIRYWREKNSYQREPDSEALKILKAYLRPEFETAIPLHVQTARVNEQIAALTEDQMNMLDVVYVNPRVLCSGGAGTGKTFLAIELAKRWTAEGLNVALVCRSPYLKRFLESKFEIPRLMVTLETGISTAASRAGVDKFDALIMDEGQDLLVWPGLEKLGHYLNGGLERGKWCFFYDINNQAGMFGPINIDVLHFLESFQPTRVPLLMNCRNTRIIIEKVKTLLGADMGVRGAGDGPDIRQKIVDSEEASAQATEEEIEYFVDQGGLTQGELTILSPRRFEQSSAAFLNNRILKDLVVLDEYAFRSFPPGKISFSEILNFKGLENEAIIMLDLPFPTNGDKQAFPQHYVAMSRARALLSMIFRKS
jgi:hypothetical protein